jgi:hypothetical protein
VKKVGLFVLFAFAANAPAFAAKTQWEAVCNQYKFKCLALPVASLPAGALITKKSQAVALDNCFKGDVNQKGSLAAATQTREFNLGAEIGAALGDYGKALVGIKHVKSVTVSFNDLSVKGFTNVRPWKENWDQCSQELKNTEMVGEVLYFGSMDLSVKTQTEAELEVAMKEIQTGLGNVGAGTNVAIMNKNTVRITGAGLALGYKAMIPNFDDKLSEETVRVNKIENIKALINSDFEVEYFNPPLKSGANFRVSNGAIPGLKQKEFKLDPHEPAALAESDNYQATLEMVQGSEKKAEIRLRQWNFKAQPLMVEPL